MSNWGETLYDICQPLGNSRFKVRKAGKDIDPAPVEHHYACAICGFSVIKFNFKKTAQIYLLRKNNYRDCISSFSANGRPETSTAGLSDIIWHFPSKSTPSAIIRLPVFISPFSLPFVVISSFVFATI